MQRVLPCLFARDDIIDIVDFQFVDQVTDVDFIDEVAAVDIEVLRAGKEL
jgi:hypothetical protein